MDAKGYRKGLQQIGRGAWAYLQPDGSWGWNNAGLIVDAGRSLLVDTLFDERLTAGMLEAMRDAVGRRGQEIDYLVNTHANGDHCFGNRLVEGAEIIASDAAAREMDEAPPEVLAALMRAAPQMGVLGEFLQHAFGSFHFEGIVLKKPTRTFSGELSLQVGAKTVELLEVGPAHTRGDVLVHVPSDRVIFTGDILFIEGTPILWAGPVANWIAACDRILAMEVDVIVPGHGPITDKQGVATMRGYLVHVDREARLRFESGMGPEEAAKDIPLGEYGRWLDSERIAVNVETLYREYRRDPSPPDALRSFGRMADLWRERRGG